jgi:hypothetical protein
MPTLWKAYQPSSKCPLQGWNLPLCEPRGNDWNVPHAAALALSGNRTQASLVKGLFNVMASLKALNERLFERMHRMFGSCSDFQVAK